MRRFPFPYALLSLFLVACGDDEPAAPADDDGQGAGSTGAGAEGGGGAAPQPGEVDAVAAPTRTTVTIDVVGSIETAPLEPAAFVITSDRGPLTVEAVAVEGQRLTLTTEKQKLGVTYELAIAAAGSDFDLQGGSFLAADTAVFWATDFEDFDDYEVTARRVGVGEHVVLYATDDVTATDVDETIQVFDSIVYPKEVELLHAAPDRDDNGKILLLGLDGGGYYGGYFSPVNTLTQEEAEEWGTHSNEMEMLYISVPALDDKFDPYGVIPHELSHLLYQEEHGGFSDWSWHNEGLAECAVQAVHGANDYAAYWYLNWPSLAAGESLVKWTYSNYAQYAQAYVFWTYAASRLGGTQAYAQLFDQAGDPANMNGFFQAELGVSLTDMQVDMMTAAWVGAPTGDYGFNGLLVLGGQPQSSPAATSLDLLPFEGVFLTGAAGQVSPSGQGPDVRYRAIDAGGNVDDAAPFSADGGVIIAVNTVQNPALNDTEPSGTFPAALPPPVLGPPVLGRDPAWRHPPPVAPWNRSKLERWRAQTRR